MAFGATVLGLLMLITGTPGLEEDDDVAELTSVGEDISIDVGRRRLSFHSCFHGASCSSVDPLRRLRGDEPSSFNLIK